jgi:cytochrome c oxidase assembly protein subunit 15
MTSDRASPQNRRAVRLWLWAVAALMFLTLTVGGATRLTGSGLSIVEWKPVTGVVPPLDAAAWQEEFEKYRAIPQYRERNAGMNLDDFKTIYWWEWAHRMLARATGAAFLLPFLWFLWRGAIERGLRVRLWAIFGLGAALGAVGWWMVASGLSERVSVSQYRLAFHLTLASLVFAAVLWTAQSVAPRAPLVAPGRIRAGATLLLALVVVQIYLGALVAGLRAGLIYNTWPLIDGSLVPDPARLFFDVPLWRNFFENSLTAQFDHRMMGYALWLLALLHATDVVRSMKGGAAFAAALALAGVVTVQAALGIVTLIQQAPLALALLHQGMAMVVLTIAVLHAQPLGRPGSSHIAERPAGDAALRREPRAT